MNIGIIGAGRLGFTLGKFLRTINENLVGYYSRNTNNAIEASNFTKTEYHSELKSLISKCDTLFLTVSDDAIKIVANELKNYDLSGKIICHTSGAKSSKEIEDLEILGCYCYSVHPLLAINDKYNSYKTFNECLITIEGNKKKINLLYDLFSKKNKVKIIKSEDKALYHAMASYSSNLIVGLLDIVNEYIKNIGLSINDYMPLIKNNINNIENYGIDKALTGPILRNDLTTIKTHLDVLNDDIIYRLLSLRLIEISKRINNKDYKDMENLLRSDKNEKNY